MDYINSYLTSFKPKSKATLERIGNLPISHIQVQRFPIATYETIGNYVSSGAIDEFKSKHGYDQLYHMRMVCRINDRLFVVQKNEDVDITDIYTQKQHTEVKDVQMNNQQITLNEMIDKTIQRIGAQKFFLYNAFTFNCQNFCKISTI